MRGCQGYQNGCACAACLRVEQEEIAEITRLLDVAPVPIEARDRDLVVWRLAEQVQAELERSTWVNADVGRRPGDLIELRGYRWPRPARVGWRVRLARAWRALWGL